MSPKRYLRNIRSKSPVWKKVLAKKYARNLTQPEAILWEELKEKKLGVWFYKQQLCLGYILDFWCPKAILCVEVDGPHHKNRKKYDNIRDNVLAKRKILTMRFTTDEVKNNLPAVLALIKNQLIRRLK